MREKTLREMGCIGAQNIRYDFLMVWGDVLSLLCRNVRWKISAHIDEGLSGGSRVRRHGSEDPHRHERKLTKLWECGKTDSSLQLPTCLHLTPMGQEKQSFVK